MFKAPDQAEADKYRHHTWVLVGFTMFLFILIVGLCAYIYKQDKAWSVQLKAKSEYIKNLKKASENDKLQGIKKRDSDKGYQTDLRKDWICDNQV